MCDERHDACTRAKTGEPGNRTPRRRVDALQLGSLCVWSEDTCPHHVYERGWRKASRGSLHFQSLLPNTCGDEKSRTSLLFARTQCQGHAIENSVPELTFFRCRSLPEGTGRDEVCVHVQVKSGAAGA